MLAGVHHAAIIASDYEKSKHFYCDILELKVKAENFREKRNSWKLDLLLPDNTQIELFSQPAGVPPPPRVSRPEACGLRHLAFKVEDLEVTVSKLQEKGVTSLEDIRVDEYTDKRFTFLADPDDLPLELYEM